jgi:hypothetical protein
VPTIPSLPSPIEKLTPPANGNTFAEAKFDSTTAPIPQGISDVASLGPSNLSSPVSSLLPVNPTAPSFALSSASTAISSHDSSNTLTPRKHLQTSNALQEELSAQLAQMATQLKRNAMHFSDSLAKDKAVIDETHEKLEGNFGVMLKERIRLRDFRGKSGSTTCMVIGIVVAVLMLFMAMISVIRFSGR